jgi:hypothetical protein
MQMHPKERAIKEKRLYEATRKNMMGAAGKVGQIAKWLGTPIIRQGSGMYDVTYLEDPYKLPQEDDIPLAEDEHHCLEGWLFDGLGRGLHLEIKYIHSEKKLTVDYKGYRVYTETAGDLDSYAPFPEWESLIEMLYKKARERQKKVEIEMKAEDDISMMGKAKNFLQMLRFKWGI